MVQDCVVVSMYGVVDRSAPGVVVDISTTVFVDVTVVAVLGIKEASVSVDDIVGIVVVKVVNFDAVGEGVGAGAVAGTGAGAGAGAGDEVVGKQHLSIHLI